MSRRKRYTRNLGRIIPSPLPARTTTEWVRFEHEREPHGVFSYVRDARSALAAEQRTEVDRLIDWFRDRLGAPDLGEQAEERLWFRAEAALQVANARRLTELINAAGVPIVERRTRRIPGKVRFEDHDPVAVLTFRDPPPPAPLKVAESSPRPAVCPPREGCRIKPGRRQRKGAESTPT